jgi:hypothetical protein
MRWHGLLELGQRLHFHVLDRGRDDSLKLSQRDLKWRVAEGEDLNAFKTGIDVVQGASRCL